jgi:acetyltransferase
MNAQAHDIQRLVPPYADADVRALAELLLDAVGSGAAVSFLATLTPEQAVQWWRTTLASAHPREIFLVARETTVSREPDADEHAQARGPIVGTVQLHPAWAPNQPHRADLAKLLVHRRCRGAGLGRRLMHAAEDAARDAGITLLTLDAKLGGVADDLYRRMGWTLVGTIPRFALDPDGVTFHDDVIFYKHL